MLIGHRVDEFDQRLGRYLVVADQRPAEAGSAQQRDLQRGEECRLTGACTPINATLPRRISPGSTSEASPCRAGIAQGLRARFR